MRFSLGVIRFVCVFACLFACYLLCVCMWKFSRTKCAGGNPPLLTGIAAAPLLSGGGTGNTICLDSSLAESSGYVDWAYGMVFFFML